MANKKNDTAETTVVGTAAPVAETPAAPAPVSVPVLVEKRRSGLVTAGIIVGAVGVAGALFGGGVLVGTHIPSGQSQQSQFGPGGFPGGPGGDRPEGGFGGPNGGGGPGPAAPGQGQPGNDDN